MQTGFFGGAEFAAGGVANACAAAIAGLAEAGNKAQNPR
jgi:hypothetical protein